MSEMAELTHCSLWICRGCLDGCGSECHTPGCGFYMNRAPDIPLKSAEPLTEGKETGSTILKLQAELNEVRRLLDGVGKSVFRARAEGRRETLDDAINTLDEVTGGLDIDWDEAAQRVAQSSRRALLRLRAAAERELEGGTNEQG